MLKEGELSFEEITNFSPLKKISENLYGNPDAPLLLPTKRVRPVGQQRKLLDAVIADVEKDFKNFKSLSGIILLCGRAFGA